MNATELKLDLFRRIDGLENKQLEQVYDKIIRLISSEPAEEPISPYLKKALDEALASSENGDVLTHEQAMDATKTKFPNLFK
jgi:hypothetical protein